MAEALKRSKGVAEALQFVADHPVQSSPDTIDVPVWELVSRQLFYVANNPDARKRGSMARATKAQRMIFDRLVGRRRPGTHPAQLAAEGLEFTDLTAGVIESPEPAEADEEEQP